MRGDESSMLHGGDEKLAEVTCVDRRQAEATFVFPRLSCGQTVSTLSDYHIFVYRFFVTRPNASTIHLIECILFAILKTIFSSSFCFLLFLFLFSFLFLFFVCLLVSLVLILLVPYILRFSFRYVKIKVCDRLNQYHQERVMSSYDTLTMNNMDAVNSTID